MGTRIFLDLTGVVLLAPGDVPVDSETLVMTLSISKICRLSFSKKLIGVELRACIHRG